MADLGAQIWLEKDDSRARIRHLFSRASDCGLGQARLFLLWPWIEPKPGQWDFRLYDEAFDAAATFGIGIKATLTANSPPWHAGNPALLHTHCGFQFPDQWGKAEVYIRFCTSRYRGHKALSQWVLWNEPRGGDERTPETLALWREFLRRHYKGDLDRLNDSWRTGYTDFGAIPFPEDIVHPTERHNVWCPYAPFLLDGAFRASWMVHQMQWIASVVREEDPATPTCVNPTIILENQPARGTNLSDFGRCVQVLGATFHPAWQFTFAPRPFFPALVYSGVRHLALHHRGGPVEVTEVQMGNTLNSSLRPNEVTPGEVARLLLAGVAGGARTVTGWLLNTRHHDYEAGDWGLLDDADEMGTRALMVRRTGELLGQVEAAGLAPLGPAPADTWIVMDPASQALEAVEGDRVGHPPGRAGGEGSHGAALLSALCLECGLSPLIAPFDALPGAPPDGGGMILMSHVVAWGAGVAERLLGFARAGGTVVLDATSGRKDPAGRLQVPWPGGAALRDAIGLRARGLRSRSDGQPLTLDGVAAGEWLLARLDPEVIDGEWSEWRELRFAEDGGPVVLERPLGRGRIVLVLGMLGPSLRWKPREAGEAARFIIGRLAESLAPAIRSHPANDEGTFVVPLRGAQGRRCWLLLAPEAVGRRCSDIRFQTRGRLTLRDLWTGSPLPPSAGGGVALGMEDGVALLVDEKAPSEPE